MKVGLIGAGPFGRALATVLVKAGHSVNIANSRGPETLKDVAASTGATAVTVQEALKGAELVILSIPEKAVPDLPADFFKAVPDSVPVVETGYTSGRQHCAQHCSAAGQRLTVAVCSSVLSATTILSSETLRWRSW
jgi:predicted dinucleotide-binding enzyme